MTTKTIDVTLLESSKYGSEIMYIGHHFDTNADYIVLGKGTATITMRMPDEVVQEQVDALEKLKSEVRANFQVEIERIDGKIQSLMAITHQPEDV